MADDFKSGICSGGSWWNPARSARFDIPPCSSAAADHTGGGTFGSWTTATTDLIETTKAARSCDDQSAGSASGSSLSFQDKAQTSSDISHPLMDSTLHLPPAFGLSSIAADWPQASLSSGRAENSFHAMLQEDLGSRSYVQHDPTIETINRVHIGTDAPSTNLSKDMNFSPDQQYHLSSGNSGSVGDVGVIAYPLLPASYGCSPTSTALQALLLEPEGKGAQQSIYDNLGVNYHQLPMMAHRESSSDLLQPPSWAKFSQLLKSSPLYKQQPSNQMQFSNNTPFWNASAVIASSGESRPGFYSPMAMPQFTAQGAFVPKPSGSNLIAKTNQEATFRPDSCSSSSTKNSGEPAFKKPRMEALSPLPTFKVRKEKLGDRITALQQLVSPFGKTDTASVLHEAIEYIKFLHDQVGVLSTPYLKGGHPTPPQQGSEKSTDSEGPKKDLRSRGLCLVPIASTYPVASDSTSDFWHPTFGGTFR